MWSSINNFIFKPYLINWADVLHGLQRANLIKLRHWWSYVPKFDLFTQSILRYDRTASIFWEITWRRMARLSSGRFHCLHFRNSSLSNINIHRYFNEGIWTMRLPSSAFILSYFYLSSCIGLSCDILLRLIFSFFRVLVIQVRRWLLIVRLLLWLRHLIMLQNPFLYNKLNLLLRIRRNNEALIIKTRR